MIHDMRKGSLVIIRKETASHCSKRGHEYEDGWAAHVRNAMSLLIFQLHVEMRGPGLMMRKIRYSADVQPCPPVDTITPARMTALRTTIFRLRDIVSRVSRHKALSMLFVLLLYENICLATG